MNWKNKELREFKEHASKKTPGSTDEDWNLFQDSLEFKKIGKGDVFVKEGLICKGSYLILKGSVVFYHLHNNKKIVNDFCFENDLVGVFLSIFFSLPAKVNIEALEDIDCLFISGANQRKLRETNSFWAKVYFRYACGNLNYRENREFSLLKESAESRYTELIRTRPDIIQKVPLNLIASYLRITPETLSRIRNRTIIN